MWHNDNLSLNESVYINTLIIPCEHTISKLLDMYNTLVDENEEAKSRIMTSVLASSFEPEFHVDCRNICAEFREDLRFRFSLGLSSLAERLLHYHRFGGGGSSSSVSPNIWSRSYVSNLAIKHRDLPNMITAPLILFAKPDNFIII